MTMESAVEASRTSSTRGPSGLRRLTLGMLGTEKVAEGFTGKPEGQGAQKPSQVLGAFKAAAPYLGIGPREVHAIDWLFTFTQPQDWTEGNHPIVWPSAALQGDTLDLGETQVKALNRHLVELGLVVMKDSPNGKRYGKRDAKGRIVEAYGFDLAPLGARQAEFEEVARKGRAERDRMRHLRRRATIARNGLTQIVETVAELGLMDPDWLRLEEEGRALARSLAKVERTDEMEIGVVSLERRQREARERLENLMPKAEETISEAVDSDPKGAENRPHQYTYKTPFYPEQDTVIATEACKSVSARGVPNPDTPGVPPDRQDERKVPAVRTDNGTVMRLSTDDLVQMAPRLRPYLQSAAPSWPDIVNAAEWLRQDLGVSRSLWGEACLAMGREQAAIAIAIVSAKPAEHFTSSPGGYFHGMVAKAKTGELNLSRTVWGLRAGNRQEGAGQRTASRMNS